MSFTIAGIHTGIGKTICSAIICQAKGYDYWKPVQAGSLEDSDSIFVQRNTSNHIKIYPEAYRLKIAASPHYAAQKEGIEITKENIQIPNSNKPIIIETAGGLMSPLSKDFLNINLIQHLDLPVILVSNNYLGSINHTLLSVEALQQRNISIEGIVFSGEKNEATESFILQFTELPLLFTIPFLPKINKESIAAVSASIVEEL
ncbi:MAG: dethiobiotin synthase [Ferruginibacter sp.]